jgi:hypothetical protein
MHTSRNIALGYLSGLLQAVSKPPGTVPNFAQSSEQIGTVPLSAAVLKLLLLTVVAGCQNSTCTVSGNVSYNGKPIERGAITFTPSDGSGPSFGGMIEKGRYEINKAYPGKRTVRITGVDESGTLADVGSPESREAMLAQAKEAGFTGTLRPADFVPVNATGNMQDVVIEQRAQTIDFELKPP